MHGTAPESLPEEDRPGDACILSAVLPPPAVGVVCVHPIFILLRGTGSGTVPSTQPTLPSSCCLCFEDSPAEHFRAVYPCVQYG